MNTEFPQTGEYWHCHHDVLHEWVTDYQERVDYIKADKPKEEIETRLKWFTPVERLPESYGKARKAYVKAWEAYVKAREARDWKKLHDEQHKGCPYDFEKGTLFP